MKTAIKFLQKAYNFSYTLSNLDIDGTIGKKTADYINLSNENIIYDQFKHMVNSHYEILVKKDPNLSKFLQGWKNRLALKTPGE